MSDKLDPKKNELVLSRNRSLAIAKSNLVKRGLELIDGGKKREGTPPTDHKKKEIKKWKFISLDEVRETGGGLFADDEKRALDEVIYEIINEIEEAGGSSLTDQEKKAIGCIIYDSQIHFRDGVKIFYSRADFDSFLNMEVKFHAMCQKVDFEKAKKAYILWAKKYHSSEYDKLVWEKK